MDGEHRVIRAIELIEDNLTTEISGDEVASQSGLSLRQFYRVFMDNTGDTLANYVRWRRLTEASKELIYTKSSILDIAIKYEFQSAEVFTRAFTRVFWNTPSAFRKIGSAHSANQKGRIFPEQFEIVREGNLNQPEIIELPQRTMVGYKVVQPHYGLRVEDNLEEGEDLGAKLQDNLHLIEHLVDGSEWNIAFRSSPLTSQHDIENLFAVEVVKQGKYPEDMEMFVLPKCTYAIFHHRGAGTLVEFTVAQAFNWLRKSHYFLGDAPSMFRLKPGEKFSGDLYIPISPIYQPQLKWWQGYSQGYLSKIAGR